ncbi:MAG TPA: glycerate kinase [Nitriliruptoraceae bacterium]|nr:glycerate kinase [Nitriliruptoraceae bacterium]
MHVLICPDSFKESLAATDVARAIDEGWRQAAPHDTTDLAPLADGGEGTVDALVTALDGTFRTQPVTGPDGSRVDATFGLVDEGRTAIIETAAASGLDLVPAARRQPMTATSRGTGELIRAALDQQVTRVIVGLGGSATVDAGSGLLQALGASLLDAQGHPIGPGGKGLASLATIDLAGLDPRLRDVELDVAVDVDNPLCGPDGAARTFGPQKGADEQAVAFLEEALAHTARVVERDLDRDLLGIAGGGAAGGLGASLAGLVDATLRPGIDLVLDAVRLHERIAEADLVVTGEGRIDGQTLRGKTPMGVARAAGRHGVPVVALAGSIGTGLGHLQERGIAAVFSIAPGPCSLEQAIDEAAHNLTATARNIAAVIHSGTRPHPGALARPS